MYYAAMVPGPSHIHRVLGNIQVIALNYIHLKRGCQLGDTFRKQLFVLQFATQGMKILFFHFSGCKTTLGSAHIPLW